LKYQWSSGRVVILTSTTCNGNTILLASREIHFHCTGIFGVLNMTLMLHLTITYTWCSYKVFIRLYPITFRTLFNFFIFASSFSPPSLSLPPHLSSFHVIKHSCGMGIALSVPLLLFSSLSIFRAASNASCKSHGYISLCEFLPPLFPI